MPYRLHQRWAGRSWIYTYCLLLYLHQLVTASRHDEISTAHKAMRSRGLGEIHEPAHGEIHFLESSPNGKHPDRVHGIMSIQQSSEAPSTLAIVSDRQNIEARRQCCTHYSYWYEYYHNVVAVS